MSKRILLILILVLAGFLRFFELSKFPPSLYWDEVAIGYNSYSVLTTGKDEYGKQLPVTFESFQDSKLPGYIYLTALSESLFGVNEFSVRFPSALLGIFSVYLVYLITNILFSPKSKYISYLASFFMAISPWALQFSRTGFEANAGLAISLVGIYFYLMFISQKKYFYLTIISIILSFYFYYQEWIFFPFLIILSTFLMRNRIMPDIKKIVAGVVLGLILLSPLIYNFFLSGSETRLAHVENVFTNPEVIKESIEKRVNTSNQIIGTLLYNRHFTRLLAFTKSYLEHFSPNYIFIEGDANPRHTISGVGLTYLWAAPFFMLGLIFIASQVRKYRAFIFLWLILSPISAALSSPVPHALRSLLMLPVLEIIISAGIYWLAYKYSKYKISIIIFVLVVSYFQFFYLQNYYTNVLKESSYWAYGYKELYQYLNAIENKYQKIYVTGDYWRPYIFMLFYNKYPADQYYSYPRHNQIGKYLFGHASYDSSDPHYIYDIDSIERLKNEGNVVMALTPTEVTQNDKVINTIYSITGKPVFVIIEPGPNLTAVNEK